MEVPYVAGGKMEDDLTQNVRQPHPKWKTTSPKNEDDEKWRRPKTKTTKNEDYQKTKTPKKEDDQKMKTTKNKDDQKQRLPKMKGKISR